MQTETYSLICLSSFIIVTFRFACFSILENSSLVNAFLKPVTTIVAFDLLTRIISFRVALGFGVFCRRVIAKTASKAWSEKGMLSVSARTKAMFL